MRVTLTFVQSWKPETSAQYRDNYLWNLMMAKFYIFHTGLFICHGLTEIITFNFRFDQNLLYQLSSDTFTFYSYSQSRHLQRRG